MNDLNADERDLLGRVLEKPELQPFFFRKAKGMKWFVPLAEKGFFSPENIPRPVPAKEKGFVSLPLWNALEYLVNTAAEFRKPANEEHAKQVVEIILAATELAKKQDFSNYRTWWQFAKLLQHIPERLLQVSDIETIDYWLDDPYDHSLVATELGTKWLPALLDTNDEHCQSLALALFDSIFRIKGSAGGQPRRRSEGELRCADWHAEKISQKVAATAGRVLGLAAVNLLQSRLESLLVGANDDKWSSVWRRAIEDHEQDQYASSAADIIVSAYRDCLLGLLAKDPVQCRKYVRAALSSRFETVIRVAVYIVDQGYVHLRDLVDLIASERFLSANLRHEVWHLLHDNFSEFSADQKRSFVRLIQEHVETNDEGIANAVWTAYWRAIWLSSIRVQSQELEKQYAEAVAVAGGEPEHPDFSSYMSGGFVDHKSPYELEDLLALSTDELVEKLNSYTGGDVFRGPSKEGLAKAVRLLVKTKPVRYASELDKFLKSDLAYVYELIEAFGELWSQKSPLPWPDVWGNLLRFIDRLVDLEAFWSPENSQQRASFVGNRHWVVGAVGRLVEAGVKSDDHAFDPHLLPLAKRVVAKVLARQEGEDFKESKDAVSLAINSPRGRVLEALINLTLRSCRLADKAEGQHERVWRQFEAAYEVELEKPSKGEYEFATLIANYLPNFLYMSKDWALAKLPIVFDVRDELRWRCAMQGYAYVGAIYPEVYLHLKNSGSFIRALDNTLVSETVRDRVVENIAVAYLNKFEELGDRSALIHQLLARGKYREIGHLIWFCWKSRDTQDAVLKERVFNLWPRIAESIDRTSTEGRKLASKLCTWIAFFDHVDERMKNLFIDVARYAEEDHSAYGVLESIAKISERQPGVAYEMWFAVLDGSRPDYPDEAIRAALKNIFREGPEGVRNAKRVVDRYIAAGNGRPAEFLSELLASPA